MNKSILNPEIHFIKAFFVFFMISNHLCIWSIEYFEQMGLPETQNQIYQIFTRIPQLQYLILFSLAIPISAGIIYRDRLSRFVAGDRLLYLPMGSIFKDALFLHLLECFVRSVAFGLDSFFDWSELKFISLSMILIALLGRIRLFLIPLLGFLILAISPWIHHELNSFSDHYFIKILIGNNGHGFFWPLFPWFFSLAFGFTFHHFYLTIPRSFFNCTILTLSLLLSLIWMQLPSLDLIEYHNVTGGKMYWPGLGFFVIYIDAFLLTFLLGSLLTRFIHFQNQGLIHCLSKGILLTYIFIYTLGHELNSFFLSHSTLSPLASLIILLMAFLFISLLIGRLALKKLGKTSYKITLRRATRKPI